MTNVKPTLAQRLVFATNLHHVSGHALEVFRLFLAVHDHIAFQAGGVLSARQHVKQPANNITAKIPFDTIYIIL